MPLPASVGLCEQDSLLGVTSALAVLQLFSSFHFPVLLSPARDLITTRWQHVSWQSSAEHLNV